MRRVSKDLGVVFDFKPFSVLYGTSGALKCEWHSVQCTSRLLGLGLVLLQELVSQHFPLNIVPGFFCIEDDDHRLKQCDTVKITRECYEGITGVNITHKAHSVTFGVQLRMPVELVAAFGYRLVTTSDLLSELTSNRHENKFYLRNFTPNTPLDKAAVRPTVISMSKFPKVLTPGRSKSSMIMTHSPGNFRVDISR